MDLVLQAVEGTIWPELTGLMKRTPISDAGQPDNGGDGRFDIAIVRSFSYGYCQSYSGYLIMGPVHLAVDSRSADDIILASVAHEFMHSLQFTYQLPGAREYDLWLAEATATWAEDYVYPR